MAIIMPSTEVEGQRNEVAENKLALSVKPLTPTSPKPLTSPTKDGFGRQRTMNLSRVSTDSRPPVPWLADKHHLPTSPLQANMQQGGTTQRLRLPKRRTPTTGRSSSSASVVEGIEMDMVGPMSSPIANTNAAKAEQHKVDIPGSYRDSVKSNPATLNEAFHSFTHDPVSPVRSTRSMSAARSNITIGGASRGNISHRLSQSISQSAGGHMLSLSAATSPTLPISARPRIHSSLSSARGFSGQRHSTDTQNGGNVDLTIRLSVDASSALSYQMLLEGDSVLSDLCVLEDENQRTVSAAQARLGRKLVALYFAATWSADCDHFTPQLLGVSSANRDDLVVVHISADNHPDDMARLVSGTGWLCVPWCDRKLRQDLMDKMTVSISDLPRLVVLDGSTHQIVSNSAAADVERKPLTCVRDWKANRSGLSWWSRTNPW